MHRAPPRDPHERAPPEEDTVSYLNCLYIRRPFVPSCFIPAIDRRTTPALAPEHKRVRELELGECVHALVDAMELNGASLLD